MLPTQPVVRGVLDRRSSDPCAERATAGITHRSMPRAAVRSVGRDWAGATQPGLAWFEVEFAGRVV